MAGDALKGVTISPILRESSLPHSIHRVGPEDLPLPTTFGPYELLRLIGAGGMARVYEARLSGLHGFEKRLAIKMMLPEHAGDTEFVTMLIDEAKIAVALNHSNICQVQDLGCIDDRYYIAMEYVEGADLNKVVNRSIRARIPIPFDVVTEIGQGICNGLDYAHAKTDVQGNPFNIIHRDISPANILISMSGEVKIVDFGVAKAAHRSQHTTIGVVKGKYQYMSPEQVTGRKLDYRSDIFAAGIVMYETIAGRMMYPEGPDMLDRIRLGKMRPLTQVRPDVPPGLARIIGRALSRRADDRYQYAGEMGEALAEFRLIYQTRHGRGRLDDLMEHLFGQQVASKRQEPQLQQDRSSKPPTPRHVPPAQAPVAVHPAPVRAPEIRLPDPPPRRQASAPPPPAAHAPTPMRPSHGGANTSGLDWDEAEEATRAEPERRPPPVPPWSGGQAASSSGVPANHKAANPFDQVPNVFDDEDEDEAEATVAFDASGSGKFEENEDDEYEDDDEDDEDGYEYEDDLQTEAGESFYTLTDQQSPLVDLQPPGAAEVDTTLRQRHPLTHPEDTIELSSSNAEVDIDIDIDIDLSLMSAAGKGRTSAFFLTADPEGKVSGPYSRAQLVDLSLAGKLAVTHLVTPTAGASTPHPHQNAEWSPAGLYVIDGDTEYEAQIALQLPTATQTYATESDPAARLFLRMAAKQRNGVLIFDRPGVHKEVTFVQGQPTYASSNIPIEQFGRRLIDLGLLTEEGLTHALATGFSNGGTLAEALVTLGLVRQEAINGCLERLVRTRLLELFTWTTGQVTHHPGVFDAAPIDLVVEPLQMIQEGVQGVAGPDGASAWLRSQASRTFILTGDSRKPLEFLGIPQRTLDFLDRFAAPMNIHEVIAVVVSEQLDDEEVAQAILVAFQVGYLAVVSE